MCEQWAIIWFLNSEEMGSKFLKSCVKARPMSINMSCDQSRHRVDMSRSIFFCRSTCQADRHSVCFQQRISIDRLQCGRMSVDIDSIELDKHWKTRLLFISMMNFQCEWFCWTTSRFKCRRHLTIDICGATMSIDMSIDMSWIVLQTRPQPNYYFILGD